MLDKSHLRPFEGQAELLAGEADGGGVDDGHELLHVLGEELVEEALVPLHQVHQVHVLVQRVLHITLHYITLYIFVSANKNPYLTRIQK